MRILVCLCLFWGTSSVVQAEANPWFPTSPLAIGIDRIIGENNLEPIEEAMGTDFYDMARSVSRVEMSGGYCTGFRVAEDLIMTNNHCLSSCSSLNFRFGYERALGRDAEVLYRCVKVEAKSRNLDYALLRVQLVSGNRPDDYPSVTLVTRELFEDDLLFVSGHPSARRKEMDRSENCKLVEWPDGGTSLKHSCDTQSGNSGSPVFERATGYVVAIHWGYSNYNRATTMANVVKHIEDTNPEVYQELNIVE